MVPPRRREGGAASDRVAVWASQVRALGVAAPGRDVIDSVVLQTFFFWQMVGDNGDLVQVEEVVLNL